MFWFATPFMGPAQLRRGRPFGLSGNVGVELRGKLAGFAGFLMRLRDVAGLFRGMGAVDGV